MSARRPSPWIARRKTALRFLPLAFLLLAARLHAESWGVLSSQEVAQVRVACGLLGVTEQDLGFEKDVAEPGWVVEWTRTALEDPAALPRAAESLWEAAADGTPTSLWAAAAALSGVVPAEVPAAPGEDDTVGGEELDPALQRALTVFLAEAKRADALLQRAHAQVTPEEKAYLAASSLGGVFDAEDEPATRDALLAIGVSTGALQDVLAEARALDGKPAADRFFAAARKVDQGALLAAARLFQEAVYRLAAAAREVRVWPSGHVLLVTALGNVRIASAGDDAYSDRALLILAPRGNNRYQGGAGVANGLSGPRLAAVIDLGGDDRYLGEGLLGPGSALFGVSVVLDVEGDDNWRARYAGQGAGVFGAAWVEDRAGDDAYTARALAQGAAVAGLAVLRDGAGSDRYSVGLQGQGYGSLPGFALLLDDAGEDTYTAGGREHDYERNDDRFVSQAQGASFGARPQAGGGVAALVDRAGNDVYIADVYGQGVGYYYSAGLLLDGAGHDRYTVHQYGQGAGIHLALGLLADFAGDDHYVGDTLVQGCAHDFAVGGLLDRAGRDTYTASRDAQGHGMNLALGWLVDGGGDDVYSARDPVTSQGAGNEGLPRDVGSLGLLIDLGGADRYSCGALDGQSTLRPAYGVVHDVEASP